MAKEDCHMTSLLRLGGDLRSSIAKPFDEMLDEFFDTFFENRSMLFDKVKSKSLFSHTPI